MPNWKSGFEPDEPESQLSNSVRTEMGTGYYPCPLTPKWSHARLASVESSHQLLPQPKRLYRYVRMVLPVWETIQPVPVDLCVDLSILPSPSVASSLTVSSRFSVKE